MNRNDSPRVSNKLYEIVKDIINNKNVLDNFSSDFLDSIQSEEELFVFYKYKYKYKINTLIHI
jgi:hypothetical protein